MIKLPRWLQLTLVALLVAVGVYLLRPQPVTVEVGLVERQAFFEAIEEQGRTRARNPYTITAPVAGQLLRPTLDAGDAISSGQVVATLAPAPQDPRTTAYAEASIKAAEARLASAEAALQETRSAHERITRQLARRRELFNQNLASAEETELYEQMEVAERNRVQSAEAAVAAAQADIESTQALLLGSSPESNGSGIVEIKAPVDGTIYRIFEDSERVVQAGTPLLEMSNQDSLEVVIDLLTRDAVRVQPGNTVYLADWGGDQTINAIVRTIEPEAYTKVSALGVEEQRVNVIADLVERPEGLGAEYRVEAAIVTWQGNTLTIPTSAIFQRSNGWNTFVIEGNRAELRPIIIASRGRDFTRVLGGIDEGEQVVLYPSDLISEGTSVLLAD